MTLVVDCCMRGALSATRRYCLAYLARAGVKDYQLVDLAQAPVPPLDGEQLALRDRLCAQRDFDHPMFALAHQFRQADEIILAAPFWDLSFPAVLKAYLEQIMVCGLTFHYNEQGECVGLCRAGQLRYFSTCGGFVGEHHLGYEYLQALCGMLGIPKTIPYIVEGLDIDPSQREALLEQAIATLPTPPSALWADRSPI